MRADSSVEAQRKKSGAWNSIVACVCESMMRTPLILRVENQAVNCAEWPKRHAPRFFCCRKRRIHAAEVGSRYASSMAGPAIVASRPPEMRLR
jgi:hypothetical protein